MTTYDKVAHLFGTAALGLITVSASMKPGTIPAWLIIVSAVVAFATGVTTSPVMQKPTVGEAVEKAKVGCILLLGLSLLATSCAHVQPYVGPVVRCAGVDIAPYAGEVAADLTTGNFADLDALAVVHGVPFVACVIRAFLAKTNAGPATRNGSEWLKARDVTFAD